MARSSAHTTTAGTIVSYDPATDTATCELTGAGAFDTWIKGVTLASAVNRAYAVFGAIVTLDSPDPARLCDFTVIAITNPGTLVTETTSGQIITQSGSAIYATDASGHMPLYTVTFTNPFSATPTSVNAGGYPGISWSVSNISPSGFSFTLAPGTYSPNTGFMLTWSATGNK